MLLRRRRLLDFGLVLLLMSLGIALTSVAHADTNSDVVKGLTQTGVYVTNQPPPKAHVRPGDAKRLKAQVDAADRQGVSEDIAIVSHYPARYHNVAEAAFALRQFLDFSGVLVLVAPNGIALSSDVITASQSEAIARKVRTTCLATSFTACAIEAGKLAVTQQKADQQSSFHDALVFWIVVLVVLALVILIVALALRRRRARAGAHLEDLRRAANQTLGQADTMIEQLERQTKPLAKDARTDYDRALGLRDRARTEIDRATSEQMLIQANEDAAQAVLALQGVSRKAGIETEPNPLDLPERRCFYCGHSDRPPYAQRTIDDGKGNSMQVDICSVCQAQLERGQTPRVATVQYNGAMVPWWAVPASPWYYSYGGPTWQYWLPFLIGMDVGGWFGGGWNSFGYYGGDWDGGGWVGGQPIDQSAPLGAGGADFGGWGDAGGTSGADSSGWGDMGSGTFGDAGGADFGGWGDGGDSGGWDAGGADFGGGGDFGGGDSGGGWG